MNEVSEDLEATREMIGEEFACVQLQKRTSEAEGRGANPGSDRLEHLEVDFIESAPLALMCG